MHVKRSKELDDNLQTKNDKKDALVIARLLKDGRFSYPRLLKEVGHGRVRHHKFRSDPLCIT